MERIAIQLTLLFCGCLLAFMRGGRDERRIASGLLGMLVADLLYHRVIEGVGSYSTVDLAHFAIDLCASVWFLFVVIRSERAWPIWILGSQLVALLGHVMRYLKADVSQMAYAVAYRFPFYLQTSVLLIVMLMLLWTSRRSASMRS